MKNVLLYILKIDIISSAKKVLKNHYTAGTINEILKEYRKKLHQLKVSAPRERTLGGRILIELGIITNAFYQVLIERGQSQENATKILFDVTWRVYRKIGKFSWIVSGLGAKSTYLHLQKTTKLFRKFPFSQPSYIWENVDSGKDIVGFNCLRCPVAEYFKSHNLSKLCVETWCNLDYPLADEIWHSKLIRTGSIAGGATICDFRWKVKT